MINWLFWSVAIAIGLFAAWHFFCAREIRNVNKEINRALEGLTADNAETAFAKSELLLPAWKDFDASLTSDKKFSTASAAEFFSPQNLTRGLNMSFWQAYGGIFTGLGILGTFGGLVYGLYGVDMSGGDIDVLKSGIAKLLSGVETAFVTSLVGIACAIVYSVAHHWLLKSFRERLAQLSARLDKIFPRRTAEDWLAKSLAEQQLHTAALQKLGDAIDKFSSDSVEAIGEVFRKKVGSQMDNFSAALDRFTKAIDDKLIAALNAHAKQTKTSADNFNKAVDKQENLLTDVTNKNVAQINAAVDNFNKTIDSQQKLLEAVTNNNVKQLNDAVNANRDVIEQMRQMLQASADFLRAVDKSGTSLNQSADALLRVNGQLLTKLPELAVQMKNLLDTNEFTRDNLNELSTQVTTVVKNFNGLADELEKSAMIIRDALDNYNSVTNDGLKEKLRDFDKSMSAAVGYLRELVEDLTDADDFIKHNQRR